MTSDNFILCFSAYLSEAGVKNPITEAARFVIDNPDIVDDTTPQDAAQEWVSTASDAADWKDPARYGAS